MASYYIVCAAALTEFVLTAIPRITPWWCRRKGMSTLDWAQEVSRRTGPYLPNPSCPMLTMMLCLWEQNFVCAHRMGEVCAIEWGMLVASNGGD